MYCICHTHTHTSPASRSVESDVDSDEFFDADGELEGAFIQANSVITSPSVSVPITEEDPPDVEEDIEIQEENDTSSKYMMVCLSKCITDGVQYIQG